MWGKSSYHRNYVIVAENIRQVQLREEQSKAFSIITIDLRYDPAIPLMGISLKPYFPLKKRRQKHCVSDFCWPCVTKVGVCKRYCLSDSVL